MSTTFFSQFPSIGEFLCKHEDGDPIEHIDSVRVTDYDVRQNAALRALCALRKRGIDVTGDEEFVACLNQHRDIALGAIKFARIDEIRKLRGRGESGSAWRRLHRRISTLPDAEPETDYLLPEELKALEEALIDPDWEAEFEHIECDWKGELGRLYDEATPAQQEAIRFMRTLKERKDQGLDCTSNAIRSKLKRLRQETGWQLNTRYL